MSFKTSKPRQEEEPAAHLCSHCRREAVLHLHYRADGRPAIGSDHVARSEYRCLPCHGRIRAEKERSRLDDMLDERIQANLQWQRMPGEARRDYQRRMIAECKALAGKSGIQRSPYADEQRSEAPSQPSESTQGAHPKGWGQADC